MLFEQPESSQTDVLQLSSSVGINKVRWGQIVTVGGVRQRGNAESGKQFPHDECAMAIVVLQRPVVGDGWSGVIHSVSQAG